MTELNKLLLEFQGLRNTIKHNHEELTEKEESSVSLINVRLQEQVTIIKNRVNELYNKNNKLCHENRPKNKSNAIRIATARK